MLVYILAYESNDIKTKSTDFANSVEHLNNEEIKITHKKHTYATKSKALKSRDIGTILRQSFWC